MRYKCVRSPLLPSSRKRFDRFRAKLYRGFDDLGESKGRADPLFVGRSFRQGSDDGEWRSGEGGDSVSVRWRWWHALAVVESTSCQV